MKGITENCHFLKTSNIKSLHFSVNNYYKNNNKLLLICCLYDYANKQSP